MYKVAPPPPSLKKNVGGGGGGGGRVEGSFIIVNIVITSDYILSENLCHTKSSIESHEFMCQVIMVYVFSRVPKNRYSAKMSMFTVIRISHLCI